MEYQPSMKWSVGDLTEVQREHYEIAQWFDDAFEVNEFQARYREQYPNRPKGSILPSDFAYNNDQVAKNEFPSFLERVNRATYRFVGLVDPISDGGRNPNWSRDEGIDVLIIIPDSE